MNVSLTPLETQLLVNPNFESNEINSRELAGKKRRVTTLRKKFNNALKVQKLSQRQLAEQINVTQNEVSRFINGKTIKLDSSVKLAQKLEDMVLKNPKVSKVNKVVPKNNYANNKANESANVKKNDARDKMINAIIETGVSNGKILTLPFEDCKIELRLKKEFKNNFHYVGVERELDTYKNMQKTAIENDLLMDTVYGSIGDVIYKSQKDAFKHIILDYCGQFSTFENEIHHAIKNDIVQLNGTIAITVSKVRDGKTCNVAKNNYSEKVLNQLNVNPTEIGIINSINKANENNKYQITEFFPYHDSCAMLLVIVKRIA